jgi:triacylglycerol esterase/lipase EstA (alpha/beta hydrolase family)
VRIGRYFAAFALTFSTVVTVAAPANAASGDSNAATPVIYVHGYNTDGKGSDCGIWSDMRAFTTGNGFTGPQVTLKYYYNDLNCGVDLNNYGSQSTHFPGGQVNGQDSTGTDIRHIAYQFAWYVHDTYTSKGQNVGVVGHSMGGLVIRYALYRVAAGDPDFPPSLLISNIVNFGSPHSGANIAAVCAASNVECTEMTPGSAFLGDLNANRQSPQATGGTDWTLMGSDFDTTVADDSATSMTANHEVRFASSNLIGHSDFYRKTRTTRDANLSYSDHGSAYTSTTSGEWSVLRAHEALSGAGY